jgi:hypothetical protein
MLSLDCMHISKGCHMGRCRAKEAQTGAANDQDAHVHCTAAGDGTSGVLAVRPARNAKSNVHLYLMT